MEKGNSQLEYEQPMGHTGGLLCTWDSDVTRCQSHASITSCECVPCSNRTARASELGSCQSSFV